MCGWSDDGAFDARVDKYSDAEPAASTSMVAVISGQCSVLLVLVQV